MSLLVKITLSYVVGVCCARLGVSIEILPWLFCVFMLVVVGWFWRKPGRMFGLLLIIWCGVGFVRQHTQQQINEQALFSIGAEPQTVRVCARLIQPLKQYPYSQRGRIQLIAWNVGLGWEPSQMDLLVEINDPLAQWELYSTFLIQGQLTRISKPTNLGEWDAHEYYRNQGVLGQLKVRTHDPWILVRHPHEKVRGLLSARQQLRNRLKYFYYDHFTESQAALLEALLLNQKSALSYAQKLLFQHTGMFHILVVSGFHIGLMGVFLEYGLRLMRFSHRIRPILVFGGLLIYAGFLGPTTPIQRAVIMAGWICGSRWLDWPVTWQHVLAGSALTLLLWQPHQLFTASFQLSFGAVLSLCLFVGKSEVPFRFLKILILSFRSTLAVWIGLWPLLLFYFQRFAWVGVIGNVILTPVVCLVFGIGALVSGLYLLGIKVLLLNSIVALLIDGVIFVLVNFQSWSLSSWILAPPHWILMVLYYAGLVGSFLLPRLKLAKVICCVVFLEVIGLSLFPQSKGELILDVLDVGHGDAMVIRSKQLGVILIDAGTTGSGRSVVVPWLKYHGINALDMAINTHPDQDHLGGMIPVLQEVKVKQFFSNGDHGSTESAREVLMLLKKQGVSYQTLVRNDRLYLDESVGLEVIHPPINQELLKESNEKSLVIKLKYGSVVFLLTGDADESAIPHMLQNANELKSHILKIPHHGSDLGVSQSQFFDAVSPHWALLSVGDRQGLPAETTLSILKHKVTQTWSTKTGGALTITTDGHSVQIKTFKGDLAESFVVESIL